jgi:hypothetical protein
MDTHPEIVATLPPLCCDTGRIPYYGNRLCITFSMVSKASTPQERLPGAIQGRSLAMVIFIRGIFTLMFI